MPRVHRVMDVQGAVCWRSSAGGCLSNHPPTLRLGARVWPRGGRRCLEVPPTGYTATATSKLINCKCCGSALSKPKSEGAIRSGEIEAAFLSVPGARLNGAISPTHPEIGDTSLQASNELIDQTVRSESHPLSSKHASSHNDY